MDSPEIGSYWFLPSGNCYVVISTDDGHIDTICINDLSATQIERIHNDPGEWTDYDYRDKFSDGTYTPVEDLLPDPCPKCESGWVDNKDYLCRVCRFGL